MMLVKELWGILDGGTGDYRLTAPRAHPLDSMDRASHKVIPYACMCEQWDPQIQGPFFSGQN